MTQAELSHRKNLRLTLVLITLALAYYRHILPYAVEKFKRYAINVWGVDVTGKSDIQIAEEGLFEMEKWMREIGLVMEISSLGVTESMIPDMAKAVVIKTGGYKILTEQEIVEILTKSL